MSPVPLPGIISLSLNSVKSVPDLYRFTTDMFHHAVTLTYEPLTLNVCSTSCVMWSNFVSRWNEIEQFATDL